MTEFFLNIVNMSISAGWIVLAVLLLRLLLKKAPKWITVLLWGIVAVRLVCPFSIESALSLIPSSQTINPKVSLNSPVIDSGVPIIDNVINPVIGEATITLQPEKDLNFFQFVMPYLAGLWLVGITALLIYTVVSYVRVKKKIGTAVLLRDNIFQSENVVSPFVLGIIKPKIYLPFRMNEQDMEHVIAHEQAHIRRKDHWWKPLGFLILTLHWFNPLMWLGYVLLCRDIELACDEKVIKELNAEQKADYSQALLTCSVNRRMIAACPLAFGEVGVKDRVKSVLNYKKPAFWIIVVAVVASIVVAVCFLTDPINQTDTVLNKLVNLEDYEVIEQDQKSITLTIPLSDLPDSIYSESGKEFGSNEIVAYKNTTTSIYLKEARYSNEGNQNLYFCFDFSFDLPKKQGVLLYPYEITNNGLSGSVRTVDGVLKADNGEFSDAVNDRGQGSYNLIWFYVSTDALKQAQGTIRFDVLLNEITYFLDGDDYSSISNVGGADNPNNIITEIIDRTVTEGIPTDQALQPFCIDEEYIYSFPSIRNEYVIVKFNNGDEMTVSNALRQGLITIADLDRWNIQYYKKEYDGELELNENGDIVRISSYPKDLYHTTLSHLRTLYEQTPTELIQEKHDYGAFVITKMHYYNTQKEWCANGYTYKYRLEITGRMNNAAKDSTYIVLSNNKNITFEQAWKAFGFSSLSADYFNPEEAIIVGYK